MISTINLYCSSRWALLILCLSNFSRWNMHRISNFKSIERLSQLQDRRFTERGNIGRKQSYTTQVNGRSFYIEHIRLIALSLAYNHASAGLQCAYFATVTLSIEFNGIRWKKRLQGAPVSPFTSLSLLRITNVSSILGDVGKLHCPFCTLQTPTCEQCFGNGAVFKFSSLSFLQVECIVCM